MGEETKIMFVKKWLYPLISCGVQTDRYEMIIDLLTADLTHSRIVNE